MYKVAIVFTSVSFMLSTNAGLATSISIEELKEDPKPLQKKSEEQILEKGSSFVPKLPAIDEKEIEAASRRADRMLGFKKKNNLQYNKYREN
ncbi:MAG: hypothetical protein IBJ00_00595 [Alphaproteobacteria bacterium]|nr:hypothetical protein [Alphaproteobacteria bacterium]